MGIFSGIAGHFAHRAMKKEVQGFIEWLRSIPLEERARLLILVYASSGQQVVPTEEFCDRAIARGFHPDLIDAQILRTRDYNSANQTVLMEWLEAAMKAENAPLVLSLKVHTYTNLATSYPEEYGDVVRTLWHTLFEASHLVKSQFPKMQAQIPEGGRVEMVACITAFAYVPHGINLEDFLQNPKLLTPHFLVPDSPVTKRIKQIEGSCENPPA
jgi:hypothetical protein